MWIEKHWRRKSFHHSICDGVSRGSENWLMFVCVCVCVRACGCECVCMCVWRFSGSAEDKWLPLLRWSFELRRLCDAVILKAQCESYRPQCLTTHTAWIHIEPPAIQRVNSVTATPSLYWLVPPHKQHNTRFRCFEIFTFSLCVQGWLFPTKILLTAICRCQWLFWFCRGL